MKQKYKISDIVRIKATGEKKRIMEVAEVGCGILYGIGNTWYKESELKPYRLSRCGVRGKDGRFVSQHGIKGFCSVIESMRTTPEKIGKLLELNTPSDETNKNISVLVNKINMLIDANSALEERVMQLEKRV